MIAEARCACVLQVNQLLSHLLRGFDLVNSIIKYKNHRYNQNQCSEDDEKDIQFNLCEGHRPGFQQEVSFGGKAYPIFRKDKN